MALRHGRVRLLSLQKLVWNAGKVKCKTSVQSSQPEASHHCVRCPEAHSAPWFPRSWTHRGKGDEDSAEHGGCVRDNVVLESGAILCHSTHTADLLLTAHRITAFAEWEGTHKHHQVQLLGLHRTIPKSSTTCPRMLSKHSSSIRIGAVTILGSLFQCPAINPLGKEPLSNVHPKLSPGFELSQQCSTGGQAYPAGHTVTGTSQDALAPLGFHHSNPAIILQGTGQN